MARDDDGQVYLPAWRRAYDRLVKMLHQAYAQAEELSVEREHLIAELQFLQSASRERGEISQACLQQVRTIRVLALCLCDWIWGRPSLGRGSRKETRWSRDKLSSSAGGGGGCEDED